MLRNNRGQVFAIIEILVVAVILLGGAYYTASTYLGHSRAGKSGPGQPATPIQRGQGVDCGNNLQQIRLAIQMCQQNSTEENVKLPATLDELADKMGLSKSMLKCSVSGNPYVYDPAQGTVKCTTPGHEKY
jgi:hypothetical protein